MTGALSSIYDMGLSQDAGYPETIRNCHLWPWKTHTKVEYSRIIVDSSMHN